MNKKQRMAWLFLPCFWGLLTLSNTALAQAESTASAQVESEVQAARARIMNSAAVSESPETVSPPQALDAIPADADDSASTDGNSEAQAAEAEPISGNEGNSVSTEPETASPYEDAATTPAETDEAELIFNDRPEPKIISTRLPVSTAVVVTFCSPVRFDSKQKEPFPVTAVLSHPITDRAGTVVAPMRSLVNLQIQPKRRMVKMQVSSLIVDGRLVPIQTTQLAIPVLSRAHPDSQNSFFDSSGVPTEGVALNVVNNLQGWVSDQGLISGGVSDLLGVGLSVASGVTSAFHSPQGKKVSELPSGVSLIFALDTPITLSGVRIDPSYSAPQSGTDPCQAFSDRDNDDFSGASSSFGSDEPY
ncbi:MAG: hypothetical protein AAF329_06620 [Cyanobacteria bacterium P01_A01_bin.17]